VKIHFLIGFNNSINLLLCIKYMNISMERIRALLLGYIKPCLIEFYLIEILNFNIKISHLDFIYITADLYTFVMIL